MAGRTLLHYQLLEKLGAGGMGEVYKAQDARLNRFVAIKSLPGAMSGDPGRRRRFIQEAQAASALNHPNIITIYDIVSEDEAEYMVMEYVDGKTLTEVIPKGGLRAPLALQYAVQIADALSAAHAAGIIHRDLKPGNVMINASGRIKILDFGLAKVSDRATISLTDETVSLAGQDTLTMEGSILGTVSYMSPEQAQGKRVDARSDIFSFGAVLYEMVTSQRAFDGESGISVITAVLRDEAKPIAELVSDVPPQLEQIVSRCLRKSVDERWQSMQEVLSELTILKQQSDSGGLYRSQIQVPPPPAPAPAPKPGFSKAALVAVAAIAIAAGGWWWTSHRNPAQPAAPVPAAAPAPDPAHGNAVLTNDMVLDMVQAKVPVPVILTHIRASKTGFDLSTAEVIRLNKAGVPESVIEAMHDPKHIPTPAPPSAASVPAAAPPSMTPPAPPPVPVAPLAAPASAVTVADALPIRITLADDIPVDADEGLTVRFTVADDIRAEGVVVIAKGAAVTGAIAEGSRKKFLGRMSKMTYRLQTVDAADGRKLNLRAAPGRRGDAAAQRPVDNGKGPRSKELAAARGAEYIGYIDGDQSVSVRK